MNSAPVMDRQSWLLLIFLSVLWGGSFFFIAIAVQELPPLTVALARVGLAASFLLPVLRLLGGALPSRLTDWQPFFVMSVLNNVIPFSLMMTAQMYLTGGMTSVLNATTPLFSVLIFAYVGEETLSPHRIVGVLMGLFGVAVLQGASLSMSGGQSIGMALCLIGTISYAFAGLWGRRKLAGVKPITSATCQLMCSTLIVAIAVVLIDRPWTLPAPSLRTVVALVALAAVSTAFAYILFFTILARAGATNTMLVTLLIPVTAILLGVWFLNEPLTVNEVIGALIIATSLLVLDGRPVTWLRARLGV